jgi:hypothetical protein
MQEGKGDWNVSTSLWLSIGMEIKAIAAKSDESLKVALVMLDQMKKNPAAHVDPEFIRRNALRWSTEASPFHRDGCEGRPMYTRFLFRILHELFESHAVILKLEKLVAKGGDVRLAHLSTIHSGLKEVVMREVNYVNLMQAFFKNAEQAVVYDVQNKETKDRFLLWNDVPVALRLFYPSLLRMCRVMEMVESLVCLHCLKE